MNTRSFVPPTTASVRGALRKLVLAATVAMLALGSASAFAWSQHGTAYTSRGTYNGARYGSCGGGSCSHAGGVAGPYGGFATNTGTVTRNAPGQFSNSGTATGRYGNSVQHAGDTNCAGGTCSHTGTLTGPDGKTATTSGDVTQNRAGPVFIVRVDHRLERQHGRSFGIDELRGRFVLPFGHGDRFGRRERLSLRFGDAGCAGRCHDLGQRDRYTRQHRDNKRSGDRPRASSPRAARRSSSRPSRWWLLHRPCMCRRLRSCMCRLPRLSYVPPPPVVYAPPPPPAVYVAPRVVYMTPVPRPVSMGTGSLGRERLGSGALVMSDKVKGALASVDCRLSEKIWHSIATTQHERRHARLIPMPNYLDASALVRIALHAESLAAGPCNCTRTPLDGWNSQPVSLDEQRLEEIGTLDCGR